MTLRPVAAISAMCRVAVSPQQWCNGGYGTFLPFRSAVRDVRTCLEQTFSVRPVVSHSDRNGAVRVVEPKPDHARRVALKTWLNPQVVCIAP